jgi:hypothetical protein
MSDEKQDQFWLHLSEFFLLISDFPSSDKLNPDETKINMIKYSKNHQAATFTFYKNKHHISLLVSNL